MGIDVTTTLRRAVNQLEAERDRIDRQLTALRAAIDSVPHRVPVVRAQRRRMSAAQRAAVGRRMKAYWAKRRAAQKSAGHKTAAHAGARRPARAMRRKVGAKKAAPKKTAMKATATP